MVWGVIVARPSKDDTVLKKYPFVYVTKRLLDNVALLRDPMVFVAELYMVLCTVVVISE